MHVLTYDTVYVLDSDQSSIFIWKFLKFLTVLKTVGNESAHLNFQIQSFKASLKLFYSKHILRRKKRFASERQQAKIKF